MKIIKVKVGDDDSPVNPKKMHAAFVNACKQAGVKTKGSADVFYKDFTNLAKRAPGPNGGKMFYIRQWPWIRIQFDAPNVVTFEAKLHDIRNLTGYMPDKPAGYKMNFKTVKKECNEANIAKVVANYVNSVLEKWKSQPGFNI